MIETNRTAEQDDAVNRIYATRPDGTVFAWIEPYKVGAAMELSTSEGWVYIIEPDGRVTNRAGEEVAL